MLAQIPTSAPTVGVVRRGGVYSLGPKAFEPRGVKVHRRVPTSRRRGWSNSDSCDRGQPSKSEPRGPTFGNVRAQVLVSGPRVGWGPPSTIGILQREMPPKTLPTLVLATLVLARRSQRRC